MHVLVIAASVICCFVSSVIQDVMFMTIVIDQSEIYMTAANPPRQRETYATVVIIPRWKE